MFGTSSDGADGSDGAPQRPRMRLALRLVLSFLVPTVLGLGAVGLVANHVARQTFENQLSERLISVAHAERGILQGYFANLVGRVEADDKRSLANIRKRIAHIARETGVRRAFLFDPEDGTSIVDTDEEIAFGTPYYELEADKPEVEAAIDGTSTASVLYTGDDGTPYKYAYAPLYDESGELVAIIGVEGSSTHLEDLGTFRRNLILLGAAAVLLLIGTAIVVSRRITRPIEGLVEATHRIGAGDLEAAVPRTRDDELGALERAIDSMRVALRDREEELQMMLSGIAHEVRNPLGGIELFLGMLEEDLTAEGRDLDDPQRKQVTTIRRELDYLGRVVNEFLEFARRSRIELARFTAVAFADEISEVMAADLVERGIELDIELAEPDSGPLELTADRDRLKRVVVNLIRNACQASDEGDTIHVSMDAPDEGTRRIVVRDEGSGIPPEKVANVFRPFFTTREKGTGLGLPLARKVLDAHRGTIDIESELGVGTTLTLVFPFVDSLERTGTSSQMEIPEGWLG